MIFVHSTVYQLCYKMSEIYTPGILDIPNILYKSVTSVRSEINKALHI